MKDFDLTDRAEFLHDYAGTVNGNYLHYIYKNNIKDDNNIIIPAFYTCDVKIRFKPRKTCFQTIL